MARSSSQHGEVALNTYLDELLGRQQRPAVSTFQVDRPVVVNKNTYLDKLLGGKVPAPPIGPPVPSPVDWTQEPTIDPRTMPVGRMELPLPTAGADPVSVGQPAVRGKEVGPPPFDLPGPKFTGGTPRDIRVSRGTGAARPGLLDKQLDAVGLPTPGEFKIWREAARSGELDKGKKFAQPGMELKETAARGKYVGDRIRKALRPLQKDMKRAPGTSLFLMVDALAAMLDTLDRVDGPVTKESLTEQAEQFTGVGPVTMPLSTDVTAEALKWYFMGKAFEGVSQGAEVIKEIPQIQRAGRAIESMGGIEKVAKAMPRAYQAGKNAAGAFAKGYTVGAGKGAYETMGEDDAGLADFLGEMNRQGLSFGTIAATFSAVSSVDQAIAVKRLRNQMVSRGLQQVRQMMQGTVPASGKGPVQAIRVEGGKLAGEVMIQPSAQAGRGNVKLQSVKAFEDAMIKHVDNVVAAYEAELSGAIKGNLYKNIRGKAPRAQQAINDFLQRGYVPGSESFAGKSPLRTGMGDRPTVDVLKGEPLTRAGEVVEAIKHPVKAVEKFGKAKVEGRARPSAESIKAKLPSQPAARVVAPPSAAERPIKAGQERVKPAKALNAAQQKNADALKKYPNADVVAGSTRVRMTNAKGAVFQVPAGQIEKMQEKGYSLVEKAAPTKGGKEVTGKERETIDRVATRIKLTGEVVVKNKDSLHGDTDIKAISIVNNESEQDVADRIDKDGIITTLEDADIEQGFVTSEGRFVGRDEAAEITGVKGRGTPGLDSLDIPAPTEAAKDISVTATLRELQAESEVRQKIAAGTPLDAAEREQFPEIARQEDQIAKLRETPPPTPPVQPAKPVGELPAPVAKPRVKPATAQERVEHIRDGWDMTPNEIRAWSNEDEKRTAVIEHLADREDNDWNEIEQRQQDIEEMPLPTKAQRDELKELFKQGDQLIADFLAGSDNPRVAEKITPKDERGYNPAHFEEGQQVTDIYDGTVYRVGKTSRGVAKMINVKTGKVRPFNAQANDRFALAEDVQAPQYQVGDKVTVQWGDKQFPAIIHSSSANWYGVRPDMTLNEAREQKLQNMQVAKDQIIRKRLDKGAESGIISKEVGHEQEVDKTRPGRVRADRVPPLEKVPPDTVQPPEGAGRAVRAPEERGGRGRGIHEEGAEVRPGLPRVAGSSEGDMGHTARRSERQPARTGDYRITEADEIGSGGSKTKYRDNIKAIKLLKQIESENRKATPEEQAVLVKYVGWGGMPQVFDTYNEKWGKEATQLRDILDDDEYRAARASTPNAHFTSPAIIRSMWEGLKDLGFEGGKINEPSMGSGLFYGLIPKEIAANSQLYGGELDSISGRIAQQLYQSAKIQVKGFEKTSYADDFFDLFISNVPFGDYKVYDDELRKPIFNIHDYFFAKALKKTRPGGLVVFITSKGSMDKVDSSVRRYMARYGDLVGAIRLPRDTFKGIANTEVVTDILIFQKRGPKKFYAGEKFEATAMVWRGKQKFLVNEYFAKHPEHILGKLSYAGSMYRANEMTVEASKDIDVPARVREIISGLLLPEKLNAAQDVRNAERNAPSYSAPAPDHVKEGAFVVKEGRVLQRRGEELVPADIQGATVPRIKKLIAVRDAARDLLHKQLDPEATDKEIRMARHKLNVAYDSVTTKHGPLSSPYNQRVFRDDPDSPLLLALENYDPETKEVVSKAAIFTERTQTPHKEIEHVDTAEEALHASLNEKGRIDIPRMAELLGQSEDEVLSELANILIYKEPITGRWEPSAMYLAGNVRRKLEQAEAAGSEYAANVKALKEVIPEDIPPGNIGVRLGSSWIPEDDYTAFIRHIIGHYRGTVHKIESEGQWVLGGSGTAAEWETSRFDTLYLIESAMNQKQVTAYDKVAGNRIVNSDETVAGRIMQQKLRDEFARWLWDDDARTERLVRTYNDTFNTTVFPQWDGSYLTLPGKVDHITLRPHQKDVIARFLTHGNLLMAHVVGSGKTYAGVGMAMEARRLGMVKKPLFVVPNHKVEDWATDWLTLYPSANILFATQDDFKPKNRQKLMNKIATGDWDGVIVPMSSFEKIPMHPDVVREFMTTQIDDMESEVRAARAESGETRSLVKELEKSKKRLEALLERQEAKWKKDAGPYFNELGIDMLFVDEAHEYKNLWFRTQMTRVPGVTQNFVQKTFDLLVKTQYINRITDNKGVVFATGTPITNSVTEMFTMQRYLQPDELIAKGSQSFDFWARNFGEITSSVEVTPTGSGFRVHDRFNKFTNVPELMQMFRMVTDIQTAKMLKLPVPKVKGGRAQTISAPESDAIHEYVQSLVARVEAMRSQKIDPTVDNMLMVTGDGRHAALDIRLRVSDAPDLATSKVNMAVDNVYQIWKDTTKTKGVQVIWCDLSTPKPGRFSIYNDIKSKLIERGIPATEIGFIHDVKDKKKLPSFFKRAVDGKMRVVLASTTKMGTGANIQKRLVAAHHIDPPWRPADIEQRDGRIIRQGNTNDEVQIYRYVTKGSFDAYMWQTLETKARFIEQVMTGKTTARAMEDIGDSGALSYAEVKAIASGNPKVMEAVKLDAEVKEMQALERAHHNEQYAIRAKVKHGLPADIAYQHKRHDGITKDLARYLKAKEAAGNDLDFVFGGKKYTKRKHAGKAMFAVLDGLNKLVDQDHGIGKVHGFNLSAKWLTHFDTGGWWQLTVNGVERYSFDISDSPEGSITTILNQFKAMADNAKGAAARAIKLEKRLAQLKEKLGSPFEKAEELKNKGTKLTALQQEIGLDDVSKRANEPLMVADREDVALKDPTADVPSQQGGFVGGRPGKARTQISAIVKEDMKTTSAAESFLRRSKGFKPTKKRMSSLRWAVEFFKEFRFLPYIPKKAEFGNVREAFRHLLEVAKLSHSTAVEDMKHALKPVAGTNIEAKRRMEAVRRKLIADDLYEDMEKGVALPPGLEATDIEAMKEKADYLYSKYPTVREAYDRIRTATQEITDMLVEEGWLNPEHAKEMYFPHKVIKYLRENDAFLGQARRPAEPRKSYLRQRKGGADYSTDVLERLIEHWAQVRRDVETSRFLQTTLKSEQANYFKQEYPEWQQGDEVPAGYKEVTVLPGRFYYKANGVSEDMAMALLLQNLELIETIMDEQNIKGKATIRQMLAVGKKRAYIVREPIARQMLDLPTQAVSDLKAYKAVTAFNTFVKRQILFNPLYAVPFNVTNFIGDGSKNFVALPSALGPKYMVNYWKRIAEAHRGEKSQRFAFAQKYGVIGSGWLGVDVKSMEALIPEIERAEISGGAKVVANKLKRLFNATKTLGQSREDWLRYALFDRLMDLQDKGKNIMKYAIKDVRAVRGITDPTQKAAKIARDIAGDYSAIGKSGRMVSDLLVPFYRWMHLNLPWWPRMIVEYSKRGDVGRLIAALMAALAPYILSYLWNYSDDDRRKHEQSLPPWKRWQFHIVNRKGTKMYYSPLPLDDVINFIGMDDNLLDYQRYQRGMISFEDLVKRIAINSTYQPGMSLINSVGGFAGVVRDLFGVKTFPDIKPYLETKWDRKAMNVAKDVFGAPGQLGEAIRREQHQKVQDLLWRSVLPVRPYSVDIEKTEELLRKSTYERSGHIKTSEGRVHRMKGEAHKGKERKVDSLRIQLEGQR